jgi:hypothetical protein
MRAGSCVASGFAQWDYFSNYGQYMPRMNCLQTAGGEPDWFWVNSLIFLNAVVLIGYVKIAVFWTRCYLAEKKEDRNHKLMNLAYIFRALRLRFFNRNFLLARLSNVGTFLSGVGSFHMAFLHVDGFVCDLIQSTSFSTGAF